MKFGGERWNQLLEADRAKLRIIFFWGLQFVKILVCYHLFFKIVYHIRTKLFTLFLEFPVKRQNVRGLVTGPYGGSTNVSFGNLFNAFRKFLIDCSIWNLFPHILEVNFPFIILEFLTYFFDFLVYSLTIKINCFACELTI